MYIVAIAWIYVVLLMAATETSWVAGLMTFIFYCVFPLSVLLYLMAAQKRKSRLKKNQSSVTAPAARASDKHPDSAVPEMSKAAQAAAQEPDQHPS